jgi:hypothetical protein
VAARNYHDDEQKKPFLLIMVSVYGEVAVADARQKTGAGLKFAEITAPSL